MSQHSFIAKRIAVAKKEGTLSKPTYALRVERDWRHAQMIDSFEGDSPIGSFCAQYNSIEGTFQILKRQFSR